MAQITIWLTASNGRDLSTDLLALIPDFCWKTDHIPDISDNVSINLESLNHLDWADDIGWIDGKVASREFEAGTDKIELTLDIERTVGQKLSRVLKSMAE